MREHHLKASTIRLDAIGVVIIPGQEPSVTYMRAGGLVASACAWSVALIGLEGRIVKVEADVGAGLPRTVLVGLPALRSIRHADRCKAAVSNSGHEWPISLLTINLSPATLPKAGSHYDLAQHAPALLWRVAERTLRSKMSLPVG